MGDWGRRLRLKGPDEGALDYAEAHYGFIDKDRELRAGRQLRADTWLTGCSATPDRFKCISSRTTACSIHFRHGGTTEELWFNNWEFGGTPVYEIMTSTTKWSPRNSSKNFKTPTLVIHGQLDYRLDVSEGFQLFHHAADYGGAVQDALLSPTKDTGLC